MACVAAFVLARRKHGGGQTHTRVVQLGVESGNCKVKPLFHVLFVLESLSKGPFEVVELLLVGPWWHCSRTSSMKISNSTLHLLFSF